MTSEEMLENVDRRRTDNDDGQRMPGCTINSHMSLRLRKAKNISTSKNVFIFNFNKLKPVLTLFIQGHVIW